MNINLELPINGLSFGQVSFGVLKEFFDRKNNFNKNMVYQTNNIIKFGIQADLPKENLRSNSKNDE